MSNSHPNQIHLLEYEEFSPEKGANLEIEKSEKQGGNEPSSPVTKKLNKQIPYSLTAGMIKTLKSFDFVQVRRIKINCHVQPKKESDIIRKINSRIYRIL